MTELRQRMIAQMKQRSFSIRTHQSYLRAVIDGERALLRVQQGKGQKDRAVILSDGILR